MSRAEGDRDQDATAQRAGGAPDGGPAGLLGYPDVVIVGAARSGSSYLAARLGAHPRIDGGAIKEPNYFSRSFDQGLSWYNELFEPRRPDLLRLDASVSYTYPQHPEALPRLAEAAPQAKLIYVVRDPIARAISHYRLLSRYFAREEHADFGSAARSNPVYLGASDYQHWLSAIAQWWAPHDVLVVPFSVTTGADAQATEQVFSFLGLEPIDLDDGSGSEHRNEVVEFKSEWMRVLRRRVRHSRAYPLLRRGLGPSTMRRLRQAMTRKPEELTDADALASCTAAELAELEALAVRSRAAVRDALVEQDRRLGLAWADAWDTSDTA